eukprot:8503958-Pyramimonas_sp.AAC.1
MDDFCKPLLAPKDMAYAADGVVVPKRNDMYMDQSLEARQYALFRSKQDGVPAMWSRLRDTQRARWCRAVWGMSMKT